MRKMTCRQEQIMTLLLHGLGRRRVAKQLGLTCCTVWGHFDALRQKGWVETTQSDGCWRKVVLTPVGREMLNRGLERRIYEEGNSCNKADH